jgi:integrase
MAWITAKSNGGWLVRWREPGSRRVRSKYVPTESQAHELRARIDAEATARRVLQGPGIPGWSDAAESLEAEDAAFAIETYLVAMIRGNRDLRDTTRAMYLRTLRVHIAGTDVGRADVRTVTPEALTAWWGSLDAGPGALRNVQQLLSMAFTRAVRTGLIDVNPLTRAPEVRKPRRSARPAVVPLTVADIERLAEAASSARDRLEILVMAYGGLRAGEVGGLRVQDVDFKRSRVSVRQQVVRVSNDGLRITPLKTDAARRIVTLPRSVIDELRAFTKKHPPADDGRLFYGNEGGMRDSVRINGSVQKAAARAGIRTHAHALRHTAVSLWIEDGANPIDVQHMVGHADISMTLGTYGHLFAWGGEALADSMERRREAHRNGGA